MESHARAFIKAAIDLLFVLRGVSARTDLVLCLQPKKLHGLRFSIHLVNLQHVLFLGRFYHICCRRWHILVYISDLRVGADGADNFASLPSHFIKYINTWAPA